jgi:hypothetical protein
MFTQGTGMSAVLLKFKDHCQRWHQENRTHNYRGRANVMGYFTTRYGVDAVKRHKRWIVRALNNAEGIHVVEQFE